jgi:cytochrome c oxidase subunit 2
MRQMKADWYLTSYGNAVHGFTNPLNGNDNSKGVAYNEKADKRSWQAMKDFFAEIFSDPADTTVIKITAKKFEFSPNQITLKKGVEAELDLTSLDVHHGFNCPDLGIRADIVLGSTATIKVRPDKTGTFTFFCDVYCGEGHSDMNGKIVVTE